MVNYVNEKFGSSVDPNVIKAMMYVESKIGYYPGTARANGSFDVMQCLRPNVHAVYRLAARNGEKPFDPNEARKYIPADGYGLFQKLFPDGKYNNSAATVEMSILGGTIWLAYKNYKPADYGSGTGYGIEVDDALNLMGVK
jgi:hypothetical protein